MVRYCGSFLLGFSANRLLKKAHSLRVLKVALNGFQHLIFDGACYLLF